MPTVLLHRTVGSLWERLLPSHPRFPAVVFIILVGALGACTPSEQASRQRHIESIKEARQEIRQDREPARQARMDEIVSGTPTPGELCLSDDKSESRLDWPRGDDFESAPVLVGVYSAYDYFYASADAENTKQGTTLWCVDFPGVRVSHATEVPSWSSDLSPERAQELEREFWKGTLVELVGGTDTIERRLFDVRFVDDPNGQTHGILYATNPDLLRLLPFGIGIQCSEVKEYKVGIK